MTICRISGEIQSSLIMKVRINRMNRFYSESFCYYNGVVDFECKKA